MLTGELESDGDQFWVADATIGYRLPDRYGLIALEARNLFDERFKFQDFDFDRIDQTTLPIRMIAPERTILGRLIFNSERERCGMPRCAKSSNGRKYVARDLSSPGASGSSQIKGGESMRTMTRMLMAGLIMSGLTHFPADAANLDTPIATIELDAQGNVTRIAFSNGDERRCHEARANSRGGKDWQG